MRPVCHVYDAPWQAMTDFIIQVWGDPPLPPHRMQCPARKVYQCHRCGRLRWACRLRIKVFYDRVIVGCIDQTQCEHDRPPRRRPRR